jgi:hypothetical protein
MSLQIGPATAATVRGHDTEGMTPVRLDVIEGPGLCACGCGQAVRYTFAKNHWRGGPIEFWRRVPTHLPEDECWEWMGFRDHARGGYGKVGHRLVHRLMFEHYNGPIPEGMFVCHRCDNPPCCNPAHLFAGTPKDNMHDKCRKGRHVSPKKVSDEDVAEIRAAQARGVLQQDLAKQYGISEGHLSAIINGKKRHGQVRWAA